MAFPTVICHGEMLRPFLSGAVQCQEYESAAPMQPVAVGVYPGGGNQHPPSNMAIFPIRSPNTMDALPCPRWSDQPHQHSNTHPYPPHYSTELPQGSISVLHHPVEGHYLPVSPPIESLPASTACHVAEVSTLCSLPRLPVAGTHSQTDIILQPVHGGGALQCSVLEPAFIDSRCAVGDTGSLSSPVALQHYLPANIEKELLALNTAIQDTFQAADMGMPPDRKWEEMVGRHFVAQASVVLEANLSGNAQKIELQHNSIPGFFASLQEEGVHDMYFSYQGCQIDINSPISSVDCPKATLVISYTKPIAFKVFAHGVLSLKYYENGLECQDSAMGQHKLQLLSFTIEEHEEFVERSVLAQSLEEERGRAESSVGGGSPTAPSFLTGELTLSGLTERTWQFLQLHCCAVRSDVTPDGPQSVSTPMEPRINSPFDLPCSEAENACHTPTLLGGGGGDNDTVFSNSPITDDNGSGNGKQSSGSHRKRPRSHSSVGGGEGATRTRRHSRRPSSSSQRKPSYTMLVVEEPVKLSECDVQVDVREILKIESFARNSLSDTTVAEAANFADQLEVPLTGPNWSGSEPLQDDVSNRTSGSV